MTYIELQHMPDFSIEDQYDGIVCGLDEVGRGPLAGPVVAACVIIPKDKRNLDFVSDINDSKKLNAKKRDYLYNKITEHFSYSIAEISPQEIDKINILQASLKAMKIAHDKLVLSSRPTNGSGEILRSLDYARDDIYALVDGNKAPELSSKTTTVVKGDSKSKTIAAASIIAKVHRDRIMIALSKEFPHYGWETNSGYPTAQHRAALETHGITEHHRKSFAPVKKITDQENNVYT